MRQNFNQKKQSSQRGTLGRKVATVVAALTLPASLTACEQVVDAHSMQASAVPGDKEYLHAREAAESVAYRYSDCEIAGKPVPVGGRYRDNRPEAAERQAIRFQLQTTRNAAGKAAEAEYAEDDTVMWDSGVVGFIVDKETSDPLHEGNFVDNQGKQPIPDRVEKPLSDVTLYPRTEWRQEDNPKGYRIGTKMVVYADTVATVSDLENLRGYQGEVLAYCGSLVMAAGPDGHVGWDVDPAPPPMPDIDRSTDCVPIQTGPNTYTSNC